MQYLKDILFQNLTPEQKKQIQKDTNYLIQNSLNKKNRIMITKKQLLSGKSLIFGNNENEGDIYYNFKFNTYVILYNSKCVNSSKTYESALKVLTNLFEKDNLNIFEIY